MTITENFLEEIDEWKKRNPNNYKRITITGDASLETYVAEVIDVITNLQHRFYKEFNLYWRGMHGSFPIESKLQRYIDENKIYFKENHGANKYADADILRTQDLIYKMAANGWDLEELYYFQQLSVLQHFEVPTHLVDVTLDPYIALYFALGEQVFSEFNNLSRDKAYLYCFKLNDKNSNLRKANRIDFGECSSELGTVLTKDTPTVMKPRNSVVRISNQKGQFIIGSSEKWKLDKNASFVKAFPIKEDDIFVIEIPTDSVLALQSELLKYIRKTAGIGADYIYPDLEGLSKFLNSDAGKFNIWQKLKHPYWFK